MPSFLAFIILFFTFAYSSSSASEFDNLVSFTKLLINQEVIEHHIAIDGLNTLLSRGETLPKDRNVLFLQVCKQALDCEKVPHSAFFNTWLPFLTDPTTVDILCAYAEQVNVEFKPTPLYNERQQIIKEIKSLSKSIVDRLEDLKTKVVTESLLQRMGYSNATSRFHTFIKWIIEVFVKHAEDSLNTKVKLECKQGSLEIKIPKDIAFLQNFQERLFIYSNLILDKVIVAIKHDTKLNIKDGKDAQPTPDTNTEYEMFRTSIGMLLNDLEVLEEGCFCLGFTTKITNTIAKLNLLVNVPLNSPEDHHYDCFSYGSNFGLLSTFSNMFMDKANAAAYDDEISKYIFGSILKEKTLNVMTETPEEGSLDYITSRNWRMLYIRLLKIMTSSIEDDPLKPFLNNVKEEQLEVVIVDMLFYHLSAFVCDRKIYDKSPLAPHMAPMDSKVRMLSCIVKTNLNIHNQRRTVFAGGLPRHAINVEITLLPSSGDTDTKEVSTLVSIDTPLKIQVRIFNSGSGLKEHHRHIEYKQRTRYSPSFTYVLQQCSLRQLFTSLKCLIIDDEKERDLLYQGGKESAAEIVDLTPDPLPLEQSIDPQSSGSCVSYNHSVRLRSLGLFGYIIEFASKLLGLRYHARMLEVGIQEVTDELKEMLVLTPSDLRDLVTLAIRNEHLIAKKCPHFLHVKAALAFISYFQEAIVELKNVAILESFDEKKSQILLAMLEEEYKAGFGTESKKFAQDVLLLDIKPIMLGLEDKSSVIGVEVKERKQVQSLTSNVVTIELPALQRFRSKAEQVCDASKRSRFDPYACLGIAFEILDTPDLNIDKHCPELYKHMSKWNESVWKSLSMSVAYNFMHCWWDQVCPRICLSGSRPIGKTVMMLLNQFKDCTNWEPSDKKAIFLDQMLKTITKDKKLLSMTSLEKEEEEPFYPSTKAGFETLARNTMSRVLLGIMPPLVKDQAWSNTSSSFILFSLERVSPVKLDDSAKKLWIERLLLNSSNDCIRTIEDFKEFALADIKESVDMYLKQTLGYIAFQTHSDSDMFKDLLNLLIQKMVAQFTERIEELYTALRYLASKYPLVKHVIDPLAEAANKLDTELAYYSTLSGEYAADVKGPREILQKIVREMNEVKEIEQKLSLEAFFDAVYEQVCALANLCVIQKSSLVFKRWIVLYPFTHILQKYLYADKTFLDIHKILYGESKMHIPDDLDTLLPLSKFIMDNFEYNASLNEKLHPDDRPLLIVPDWKTLQVANSEIVQEWTRKDCDLITQRLEELKASAKRLKRLCEYLAKEGNKEESIKSLSSLYNPYRNESESFNSLKKIQEMTMNVEKRIMETVYPRMLSNLNFDHGHLLGLESKFKRMILHKVDMEKLRRCTMVKKLGPNEDLLKNLDEIVLLENFIRQTFYVELKEVITSLHEYFGYFLSLTKQDDIDEEYKDDRLMNTAWQCYLMINPAPSKKNQTEIIDSKDGKNQIL